MIFIGHKFIKSKPFYHIEDIDTILQTPPNSTVYFDFDEKNLDIIEYANLNDVSFALHVENITQIVYASALNASFIVVKKELAKTAQNLANNYLFDAKILVKIQNNDEIEELALLGVDGVIFSCGIVKLVNP